MNDNRATRLVGQAAEMVAKVNKQERSATDLQKWQRVQDAPLRAARCAHAREFVAYARALGLSPQTEFMLSRLMIAAKGADKLEDCPNWLLGIYLEEQAEHDIKIVRRLEAHHPVKRRLAARAKYHWDLFKAEELASGILTAQYVPGGLDKTTRGGKKPSMAFLHFVQDLVEIGRRAEKYVKPGASVEDMLEATESAAREHLAHLRLEIEQAGREGRHHERMATAFLPKESRPNRIKPDPTLPGRAAAKFQSKLSLQIADELRRGAAMEDILAALEGEAQALRAKLKEVTAQDSAVAAPAVESDYIKNISQKTIPDIRLVESGNSQASNSSLQNSSVNSQTDHSLVQTFLYQSDQSHSCPSPDVDPVEIEERAAIICESDGIAVEVSEAGYEEDAERRAQAVKQARRDLCAACQGEESAAMVSEMPTPLDAPPAVDPEYFDLKCAELAESRGISPREAARILIAEHEKRE
jgi:hypothetical protein